MLNLHGDFARPNSWQWAEVTRILAVDYGALQHKLIERWDRKTISKLEDKMECDQTYCCKADKCLLYYGAKFE
jgi:hypothetical protein